MNKKKFGLIGKNIAYSFSKSYFTKKFDTLKFSDFAYENFDIEKIDFVKDIFLQENLKGCNVTTPYKEKIIGFLDDLDPVAEKIGAVNTVLLLKNGTKKGYNTDPYGFEKSFAPLLKTHHKEALILGTGGASKAISYVLEKLKIPYQFVSRNLSENQMNYKQLSEKTLEKYKIIINCTPLGTHPALEKCPEIPYEFLNEKHFLYDLIYNPSETLFLKNGKQKNTLIKNGLEMLALQAEESWKIWNNNL